MASHGGVGDQLLSAVFFMLPGLSQVLHNDKKKVCNMRHVMPSFAYMTSRHSGITFSLSCIAWLAAFKLTRRLFLRSEDWTEQLGARSYAENIQRSTLILHPPSRLEDYTASLLPFI